MPTLHLRSLGPASLLALGLLAVSLAPHGDAAARPNVVLILTDDQDLLLGSLDAMPRLQELLVEQGTAFTNAYVPLSLCCPSRASILTGRYAHNLQVYTNNPPDGGFARFQALGHEKATVGVALQRAGYRTALLGKYLNGYPTHRAARTHVPPGWDEWTVPVAGDPYAAFQYTLNQNGRLVRHGRKPADHLTDVLARRARQVVKRAAEDGVPFFLFFAPYAPHRPATPAPRDAGLFPDARAPRTPSFDEADVSDKPRAVRNRPRLTEDQIGALDLLHRRRLQSLQAVDAAIAALIDTLERAGELDDTFILFTSDNGFHLGQHRLLQGKYKPYEEDVRVPLVVRGPGVPAGARVDAFVENVDLAPTIAELAGAELPVPPDGRSFVPLLAAPRQPPAGWRQMVLLEQFHFVEDRSEGTVLEPSEGPGGAEHVTHLGLRTSTCKYVEYGTGELEYYDLAGDPFELQNLARGMDGGRLRQLSERVRALGACREEDCRELAATPLDF